MGIGIRNGEGYYDPTAHLAVRNVEARKLKISYPSGYMELNLERFFPCPQMQAKKVYHLVYRYCSLEEQIRLQSVLEQKLAVLKQRGCAKRDIDMLQRNLENYKKGMEAKG